MSKISIEGNASGTGTLTIAAPNTNTNYTLALPEEAGTITTSNSPYSTFRNRIINGNMVIDQRNAGAAVTASSSYPVDRFPIVNATDGAFSAQQDSSAPAGFVNSLKVTITTADASLTTTQSLRLIHNIEGYNIADLGWGSASAKTITLSFWVRSSLTGTFGGSLRNTDVNRSYPYTYTISVADTWEYKTITIDGDTSGTWGTTNAVGLSVFWSLGTGPDRSGTAGAWNSNNNFSATGATSVVGTNGATWYITGVQLEVGSVATPFERRPYGTELSLCQRYFEKSATDSVFSGNVTSGGEYYNFVYYKVTKRAAATVTPTNSLALSFPTSASLVNSNGVDGFQLYRTANASARGYFFDSWTASSEL